MPLRPSTTAANIAANDDDDAAAPATTAAPIWLSYSHRDDSSKRRASPNRNVDGVHSPPKTKRNTSATPGRVVGRTVEELSVYELFDVADPSPRSVASDSSNGVATISKARANKVAQIISNMRDKPIREKRASATPKSTKKRGPKGKAKNAAKVSVPKSKPKKEPPILSAELITEIRSHIFGGAHKSLSYSNLEILAHDHKFNKQLKFCFDERRKRNKAKEGGVSTRSNTDSIDLDNDDDAYPVKATNFKELSRYVIDDILCSKEDTPFLLCIAKELDEEKNKILSDTAKQQRKLRVAGDEYTISGRSYYCLRVAIEHARDHLPIMSGMTGTKEFTKKYDEKEGFVLHMVGTDKDAGKQVRGDLVIPFKLTFSWQDVVNRPLDIMFFGQRFASHRNFDRLFKNKKDLQYIFHIFKSVAAEYWGDANASAQLYASYLNQNSDLLEEWLNNDGKSTTSKMLRSLEDMTLTQ